MMKNMIEKLLFAALAAFCVMLCMAERMLLYSYDESTYQSNMTVIAQVQQNGVFLTDCEVAVSDSKGGCRYSEANTNRLGKSPHPHDEGAPHGQPGQQDNST